MFAQFDLNNTYLTCLFAHRLRLRKTAFRQLNIVSLLHLAFVLNTMEESISLVSLISAIDMMNDVALAWRLAKLANICYCSAKIKRITSFPIWHFLYLDLNSALLARITSHLYTITTVSKLFTLKYSKEIATPQIQRAARTQKSKLTIHVCHS